MPETFDPYHTWLGIPPEQQPANHYRLLAIEAFESNPDVIESAADQRMAHLRSFQTGRHGPLTQRLLNEVSAAKICLLNPQKKAEYDAALREKLADGQAEAVAADVFSIPDETTTAVSSVTAARKGKSKPNVAMVGGAAAAGVAVVLIAAWVFLSGGDGVSPVPEATTGKMPVAPARPGDSDEKRQPKGEAAKSEFPGVTPSQSDSPPKKADEPSVAKAPEPAGESPGIAAPAAEPVKKTAEPAPPPAAAQPPSSEPAPKPAEEPTKHPVPAAEIQREVGDNIEQVFKIAEAKTPEAKVQLAKGLADEAKKTKKPDEQYMLLRKAADLACEGGDAGLMLEVVDTMGDAFAIDPSSAKAAMLERFAKGPRSPARVQSLVEGSRSAIDAAVADDRYEIASAMAKSVADACSRSAPALRKEAADRRKRVQQLQKQFDEVQKTLEGLKTNREDAEANLTVGSWHCFVKDDWNTGLAHLAKGSDATLKALAQRESASPPSSPEDQVELADGWWDAAAERRGDEKAALLRCAGHWYEQALGRLEGINKTKVEKRLSELAESGHEPASRPGREPPPAIAPFDAKRAHAYQAQWARYLKVPVEFTNAVGMKFVLIPPGEFDMGAPQQEVDEFVKVAKKDDSAPWVIAELAAQAPRHRVKISRAFYLGTCEVTQGQYAQMTGTNPSQFKQGGPNLPVERVSWDEAVAFCQRLSQSRGEKFAAGEYRLSTEAEWEYAARAGTATRFYCGDDVAGMSGYAFSAGEKPRPVGHLKPNAFGLYDMYGNVWEWCADVYDPGAYARYARGDVTPTLDGAAAPRVVRGGSLYYDAPDIFRCAVRVGNNRGFRGNDIGFRVVRTLKP